jgi:acyl-CoA reductase-like NAD-dependent aldehyde dehydrogenase
MVLIGSAPERISIYNPADGSLVSDRIPVAGEQDVDKAVLHAQKAFKAGSAWRRFTNDERRDILLKFADLLEENQERLAELTRVTLGAPFHPFGQSEIGTAITNFRCKKAQSRRINIGWRTDQEKTTPAGSINSVVSRSPPMMACTRLCATNL